MLINKTKKTNLTSAIELCESIFSKATGLMFSRKKRLDDNCLIFIFDKAQRQSLHMMFVFYSIDVLFLDDKKRVVEFATLKPFTFFNPKKKADYVIELKKGLIGSSKTNVGDIIGW